MKTLKILTVFLVVISIFSCKKGWKDTETPTRGNISILADDTFFPIVEDQATIFESQYKNATIKVINSPELEIIKKLIDSSSVYKLAVLPRDLTKGEKAYFDEKKIIPKVTDMAYDAIALIVNKNFADTTLSVANLTAILNEEIENNYSLVFDNSASSTVQYILNLTKNKQLPSKEVYSQGTNQDVIKYIAQNNNAIGFIGVNWLGQTPKSLMEYTDNIRTLAIGNDETGYFKPNQENIATQSYPFIRTLKFIDCQGAAGLGLGFSVFIAGDVGQRIVLKSGLVPIKYPKREIIINTNKLK